MLSLIRAAGVEPEIIDYLKTPPSRFNLIALAEGAGVPLRDLMPTEPSSTTDGPARAASDAP